MTRTEKRNLANLLLQHGLDNLIEFYDEFVEQYDYQELPSKDEAIPTMQAWCARITAIADKI